MFLVYMYVDLSVILYSVNFWWQQIMGPRGATASPRRADVKL